MSHVLLQLVVTHPAALAAAAGLTLLVAVVAMARRAAASTITLFLLTAGGAMLCLAAGGIRFIHPRDDAGAIFVLVDHSASTRGAASRDPRFVSRRVAELLGHQAYEVIPFGDDSAATTELPPLSGASAVVLFSDGRFAPPDVAPPIYPVIDPALDDPQDAAVTAMEQRAGEMVVAIRSHGASRMLTLTQGDGEPTNIVAPQGVYSMNRELNVTHGRIVAALSAGDRWPENDVLAMDHSPPVEKQRWWVGDSSPPAGWRHVPPTALPTDVTAYLAPAVIVLDNVPARVISYARQQRIAQFVEELGGGVVIVGGDRAFAAGGYVGTALDALSPLASTPPDPQRRWILLADASGSMAQAFEDGATRWNYATDALRITAAALPPADLLSIGQFSGELRWWSTEQSASQHMDIPNVTPSGPTRLDAALHSILADDRDLPTELVVLTDAEAEIHDAAALAGRLTRQHVRLHLLATQQLAAENPVAHLARQTGGQVVVQVDPRLWSDALSDLTRGVLPDSIMRQPMSVSFAGELSDWPTRVIEQWNHTWLKDDAQALARGMHEEQTVPLIAVWNAGAGKILAAAYRASESEADALAALVAAPPRNPRFTVQWQRRFVRIDAMDQQSPIHGLAAALRIGSHRQVIPQVAPGRYELRFDPPRAPSVAQVMVDENVIDRRAISGGYPREFDAVGNDRDALRALAERTGGRVIPPEDHNPIEFRSRAMTGIDLTPWLSALGAALLAASLLVWKWMG